MNDATVAVVERAARGARGVFHRHPVTAFFVLAIALSWAYWLPVASVGGRASHFPGLLGPMVAALISAAVVEGRPGVRGLLARMVRWRVDGIWYLAAIAPAIVAAAAVGVLALAGRGLPSVASLSTMPGVASVGWLGVFVFVLLVNGYGEEVGWRGFAMPRLRARYGLVGASVILAAWWAVWHLPTFFLDTGLDIELVVIPGWLVGLAAGALVLGWLYERAHSSLLIVAVFHAMLNMGSATRGTEGVVAGVVTAGVIVAAVVILRIEHAKGPTGRSPPRARG